MASNYGGFQSPFHRVKDCNSEMGAGGEGGKAYFQSPFHRVKDCNAPSPAVSDIGTVLSVPFSSGQGL